MRVIVEQLVEWRLEGETEVLGENLPQRHFVHHKSHMTKPGLPGWEPATNCLSYGAALVSELRIYNVERIQKGYERMWSWSIILAFVLRD
jgi:hypothetical protein